MSSVHRFIVDAIGGAGAEIVGNLGGGAAMSADLSMGSAETFYVYVRGNRAVPLARRSWQAVAAVVVVGSWSP
jgi:hypothetical protein